MVRIEAAAAASLAAILERNKFGIATAAMTIAIAALVALPCPSPEWFGQNRIMAETDEGMSVVANCGSDCVRLRRQLLHHHRHPASHILIVKS